jgi:MoxR-like ATPase
VTSPAELLEMQSDIRKVFVHDGIKEYIVDVVRSTRESNQLLMGASPRGSLHLMRGAQAHAAMEGEAFVRPDDVKAVAAAILAHRVIPRAELRAKGQTTESLIERLLDTVPVPAVK